MARGAAAAERVPARRVAPAPAGPRPAPPRRRSGPAAAPARSAPGTAARRSPAATLARLAEARLIDGLLRGRLWVGFIGALLAGIVFLNVSLLQLNQDIARAGKQSTALDRQNATLRERLAALDSSERIQRLASARGMLMPAPGQYHYVTARPWRDGALAARQVTLPQAVAAVTASQPVSASPGATAAPTPTTTTTAPAGAAQASTSTPTASATPVPAAGTATGP
jgi:cell division protein FtsL